MISSGNVSLVILYPSQITSDCNDTCKENYEPFLLRSDPNEWYNIHRDYNESVCDDEVRSKPSLFNIVSFVYFFVLFCFVLL